MKKAYWLTMSNEIQRKFPCENLCTWEQTKLKWGKMSQQYYQEKSILGIGTQALKWIQYDGMDDIIVRTAKTNGIPQGMDMAKDIGTQVNHEEVDGNTNDNTDPTSPAIQVVVFGAIPKQAPISLQFAYAHK